MNTIESLREGLKWSNDLLEMCIADVTPDQAHWLPPGNAHPIGATYAHGLIAQDMIVQGLLQGQPPLFQTTWADKTGISAVQFHQDLEWARSVKIDLAQARQYAQAVYAASEDFIASLTEQDLDRVIDLSSGGLGDRSLDWALHGIVIAHAHNMSGEIAAIKGAQGAQGYPF